MRGVGSVGAICVVAALGGGCTYILDLEGTGVQSSGGGSGAAGPGGGGSTTGGGGGAGGCAGVECDVVPLATAVNANRIVVSGGNVYWVENPPGRVMMVDTDVTPYMPVELFQLSGVANITVFGEALYAVDGTGAVFEASAMTSSTPMQRATGANLTALFLAADGMGVYWLDGNNTIQRVPSGGGGSSAVTTPPTTVQGIGVDSSMVFWTGSESVGSAPTTGGTSELLASGFMGALHFALDETHIYWYDSQQPRIMSNPRATMNAEAPVVPSITAQNPPVMLAAFGGTVYWIDGDTMTIKVGSGGQSGEELLGSARATSIAVDGNNIYWTDEGRNEILMLDR